MGSDIKSTFTGPVTEYSYGWNLSGFDSEISR
jgi:hypothetical protein